MTKALICGISGQDGAYLAQLLLDKGYQVTGTSRDAQITPFGNLQRLGIRDRVGLASMALTDFRSVLQTLAKTAPDEVYNLAGQSSVGLSFEQPVETLESIATGTLNLLEAIRFLGRPIRLYNAGSSECFGDTGGHAADETTAFRPRSPYDFVATAFAAHRLDWRDHVEQDPSLLRPADIPYNGGDATKAKTLLGWQARYRMPDIVRLRTAAESQPPAAPQI